MQKDKKLIEGVQHRATKMIPELKDKDYIDRLKALKLPSMHYRRYRGDVIAQTTALQWSTSGYEPQKCHWWTTNGTHAAIRGWDLPLIATDGPPVVHHRQKM